jgi:hypothetical protein
MADKIVASPLCKRLFIAPETGTAILGHNGRWRSVILKPSKTCDQRRYWIGHRWPEALHGIVDYFSQDEAWKYSSSVLLHQGRLEEVRFCKEFMQRHKIPTADYAHLDKINWRGHHSHSKSFYADSIESGWIGGRQRSDYMWIRRRPRLRWRRCCQVNLVQQVESCHRTIFKRNWIFCFCFDGW